MEQITIMVYAHVQNEGGKISKESDRCQKQGHHCKSRRHITRRDKV